MRLINKQMNKQTSIQPKISKQIAVDIKKYINQRRRQTNIHFRHFELDQAKNYRNQNYRFYDGFHDSTRSYDNRKIRLDNIIQPCSK